MEAAGQAIGTALGGPLGGIAGAAAAAALWAAAKGGSASDIAEAAGWAALGAIYGIYGDLAGMVGGFLIGFLSNLRGGYGGGYIDWDPLVFDIGDDGPQTSTDIIDYDIDGDGIIDKINNSNDFVLAFDKDMDGLVGEDGSELFGDSTDLNNDGVADGYANGFEALKALAVKYQLIGEEDDVLTTTDLKYLENIAGLRMKNGYLGEAYTFSELGITEIRLPKTTQTGLEENFDGQGNSLMTQQGATFIINGEERHYADIWHKKY